MASVWLLLLLSPLAYTRLDEPLEAGLLRLLLLIER